MDKNYNKAILLVMSAVFFVLGWISHATYEPRNKVVKRSLLEKIKARKKLNVVLLNAPSTYYIGADGPSGFEYDLLKDYADHLGVEMHIITAHTVKEALEYADKPGIDIISASLTKTPQREKKYYFGPSYFEVQEQVVCQRSMLGTPKFPRDVEDLEDLNIMVGEGTSYLETIEALKRDGFDINVSVTSDYTTEELLEMVSKHKIECTIVDSNIYALNLKYFPDIAMAFAISNREQLAWILPKGAQKLKADMYSWLNEYVQHGKMTQLKDHYYSYVLFFDYYNTKMFYKRIKTRLPKYEKYFKAAATRFSIPWTLLAAVSYQESHWNPRAKSFTGVRGMMMLTRHTAKLLGVKNRLDPKQSINGGAKHLRQMIKNVPKEVTGENRIKFALAAYNVGGGHIQDAMILAKRLGLNPYIWSDLKIVLPLLSQKRYYKQLRFGYARGSEPVKYVEAIYNFKSILDKTLEAKEAVHKQDGNETNATQP